MGDAARCHCEQCRRWSGDTWAAVSVANVEISGDAPRWYRSSEQAERGFCAVCGSSLFWRTIGSNRLDVALGCLDTPTGITLERHIFTAFKGDYYRIADGLPQDARE
ncbi:GFA family protein [uncultured Paracoccus sp.]|uniref:GFA family protein n=1 Tax=Paracoccus sp. S1E-3 TaxID=2756130 RepID=UPI00263A2381|nr:GFA family protein [uncultured Paracoccus sp.]